MKIINRFLLTCLILIIVIGLKAQVSNTPILLTVEKQNYKSDSIYEFDVYVTNNGVNNRLLTAFNMTFAFNNNWRNGGIMNQKATIPGGGGINTPHTLTQTGLTNALNGQNSTTTLITAGTHFLFNHANVAANTQDNAYIQVAGVIYKSEGILILPSARLYIGRFQLVNTVNFNKNIGAGLKIAFYTIRGTQVYEDSAIMGKALFNDAIFYQRQNAIVKSDAPRITSVVSNLDSVFINFPLVNKQNGYYTGNYDSSAVINKYLVQVLDTNNNLIRLSSNTTSPVVVSNLNGGFYKFRVAAVNLADTSDYSSNSNIVQIVRSYNIVTNVKNGVIQQFNAPVNNGANVQITYQANSGYAIDSIYLNGVYDSNLSKNNPTGLTIYNVQNNVQLLVVFKAISKPIVPIDTIYVCANSTISNLVNLYPTYNWYQTANSLVALSNDTYLQNAYYYTTQRVGNTESLLRDSVYIKIIDVPKIKLNDTSYCSNIIAKVVNLNSSNNVIWYDSNRVNAAPLVSSTVLQTKYYYYATQLNGCYSAKDSILVSIKSLPINPILSDTSYCSNLLAKVVNLNSNNNVIWYDSNRLNAAPLVSSTVLQTKYYYYATQLNGCYSAKDSILVSIKSLPINPRLSDTSYCSNILAKVVNLNSNNNVIWYDSNRLNAAPLVSSTVLQTKYYYYASQSNGCYSAKDSILVSIKSLPINQKIRDTNYCSNLNAKIVNINSNNNVIWYDSNRVNAAPLINSTVLQTKYYYYATQSNGCYSAKDSIFVTIKSLPLNPKLKDTNYCATNNPTLANLYPTYSNLLWYNSNLISGNALQLNNNLINKYYYFVTVSNGCYSLTDSVLVNLIPQPTNSITIKDTVFCGATTVASLNSNINNLVWYDNNSNNAVALLTTTNLTTKSYYFAVNNQCVSVKKEVKVKVIVKPVKPIITNIVEANQELIIRIDASQDTNVNNYIVLNTNNELVKISNMPIIPILNLVNGTSYSFKVIAQNCAGNSDTSNILSGTPTSSSLSINTNLNNENGGTITSPTVVSRGASYRITYKPNVGYKIDSILVNNVNVIDSINGYTFNNITTNQDIRVVFKILTFTITASAGVNGFINPPGIITVEYGSNFTYTFKPRFAYSVDSIIINNKYYDTNDKTAYSFTNITSNQTISVNFKLTSFFIKIANAVGGTISPEGDIQVSEGVDREFVLRPNAGYFVDGILVDNVKQYVDTSINKFTLRNIRENHTIVPIFKFNLLKIEAIALNGGTIEPVGSTILQQGQSMQYLIKPNNGFVVDSLIVDGVLVPTPTTLLYPFKNITTSHTIKATFKQALYSLISSASNGGTISPEGLNYSKQGDSITYVIRPNSNFELDSLIINGVKVENTFTYKISNIQSNTSVRAVFKKNQYTIISKNINGIGLNFVGTRLISSNDSVIYKVYNISNYKLDSLVVDGVRVNSTTFKFTNITSDHLIIAYFSTISLNGSISKKVDALGPYTITSSSNRPGTINPLGLLYVDAGDSQVYTIDTTTYSIDSVFVDNVNIGKRQRFTVYGDTNHIVRAVLVPKTFTIVSSSNGGGIINPTGTVIVNRNSNFNYSITPNINYIVDSFIVDGIKIDSINRYTFSNIVDNHTIRIVFKLDVLSIASSSVGGGIITPTGNIYVNRAQSQQFNFIANTGYKVDSVWIDGNYIAESLSSYTFNDIQLNHRIKVSFKPEIYYIYSYSNVEHAVDPHGISIFNKGANAYFDIVYVDNYKLDSLIIDDELNTDSIESYTFKDVKENHTIKVIMSRLSNNIISSVGNGGTISPLGTRVVPSNADITYTIRPNTGYIADSVIVDNKLVSITDSTYTFRKVDTSHTIRVTFKKKTYIITKISNIGGTLVGDTAAIYGSNVRFTITPNSNYVIDSIIVNGRKVDSINSYTFVYIENNNTIKVVFKLKTYSIISSAGNNGNITPAGTSIVSSGDNISFIIVPNNGYDIDSILVDDAFQSPISILTLTNILKNTTVRVTFKIKTYSIIATAGSGGSISPTGTTIVNFGANQTYTITANSGNVLDSLFVDDVLIANTSSYTFSNVIANHKIRAKFKVACGILTEAPIISRVGSTLVSSIDYATYNWNLDGNLIANTNSKTITPPSAGVYTLKGADVNGCFSSLSKKYYYSLSCITPTGRLGNAASIQGNIIGDNNHVIVKWCTELLKGNLTLRIIDVNGNTLLEQQIPSSIGTYIINKQLIKNPNYYIQLMDENGEIIQISDLIK